MHCWIIIRTEMKGIVDMNSNIGQKSMKSRLAPLLMSRPGHVCAGVRWIPRGPGGAQVMNGWEAVAAQRAAEERSAVRRSTC